MFLEERRTTRRSRGKELEMDGNDSAPKTTSRRRWITSAALVASGLVTGGILAGTHIAGAATTPSSTATAIAPAGRMDPSTMTHGPNETLLAGTTASKVRAAALKAVPGATVIRVETDSEGSPYEAHLRKADGSFVTVKIDKNFNVTATDDGFGGPHPGAAAPAGSNA
jgi:hypothetical protein